MTITGWKHWFSKLGRQSQHHAGDDFADYGTAFGMELSLQHASDQQHATPSSLPTPAEGLNAPPSH